MKEAICQMEAAKTVPGEDYSDGSGDASYDDEYYDDGSGEEYY